VVRRRDEAEGKSGVRQRQRLNTYRVLYTSVESSLTVKRVALICTGGNVVTFLSRLIGDEGR
jgi:hypothetical protein